MAAAGDRSHIPDSSRGVYETLNGELNRVKQTNLPVCQYRCVRLFGFRLISLAYH